MLRWLLGREPTTVEAWVDGVATKALYYHLFGFQLLRPVVLCFSSQRSNFVGLDQEAYACFPLLRVHLDCHEVCLLAIEGESENV